MRRIMSSESTYKRVLPAALVGLLLLAACDEGPTLPPEQRVPSNLTILHGDNQVGLAYKALDTLLVVQVKDSLGKVVPGVTIDWVVEQGGSVSTTPTNSGSNAIGVASAMYTLGSDGLPQTVTATVSSIPNAPRATFKARAVTAMVSVNGADTYACWYEGICSPYFGPAEVVVPAGKTVAWLWSAGGASACNVVFEDDPTEPTSSPTQQSGRHFRTFTTPGTYRFRCTAHSTSFTEGMVGTVKVE